jgi:hypothetical protein
VLILIGPAFDGSDANFRKLAQLTGLVAYDLKTKLRPGSWGVLKLLADKLQARDLTMQLQSQGLPAVLVDASVPYDQGRPIVPVERLGRVADDLVLELPGQRMQVPLRSLLTIVRGEVHIRSLRPSGVASSGNTYRAVVPTVPDIQAFRESQITSSYDAYHVADLHFATVNWVARLDARKTDLCLLEELSGSQAQKLDQVVDHIASVTNVRVDRSVRTSSLASFATRPTPMRSVSPARGTPIGDQDHRVTASDPHFDGYSRLVAQAEREAMALSAPLARASELNQ